MPKNFFQDMIKIRNNDREKLKQKVESSIQTSSAPESSVETKFASIYDAAEKSVEGGSRRALWFVAGISLLFLLFALSFLFSNAKITVNPKVKDITFNQSFSAVKNGNEDTLSFDLVVISGEENKTVQATEEKNISQKAEGAVLIYNAFSFSSQALSIDTRLEGSNGKIYKTKAKTVVPGMKKDNTPGSVQVDIYGAEAGAEYDSVPLDFKIFGFKGTPKYSKFYARSKGPIKSGLKGKFPVISDSQKTGVINELKTTLQTNLLKKATDQIPSGFILFKDAVFLNIDNSSIDYASSKNNLLPLKLTGSLYGLLFNENKLTKKIAEKNIENYDSSAVYIPNVRDLVFSLSAQAGLSSKDNTSFSDVKNIDFNLSGATKIVWKLDTDKLVNDLLGKSKKDFKQVLLEYPNIDSADLVLSPIWKMSIPDDAKKVKVIVNYPK